MIRKQNQALSYILVFALLFNLLLPFPLARAEADSLISIRIADEQAEYSLEETITFEVNYNLETLERTPGGETGEQPGEPGEQPDEPGEDPGETDEPGEEPDEPGVDPGETDEPGEDSGETGEPGTPGEGESGEPGEPETGETGQPGETDESVTGETRQPEETDETVTGETGQPGETDESVTGETGQPEETDEIVTRATHQLGETDETVIDETGQSEEPVQPEEELIVETGEAVPAEEVSGENGQGKIAEPVTIEVQLPYELEYDSHVPSKFTYDADRRMLTFTLQEGELIGSNRGTLGFAAKVVSTSSQDVQVGVKLLVGDVEKGSDQVAVKVAKPEDPISEEGVVLKGTVTKDNPLSGEIFSYVIDYSLSALTGSFTNGELVVQLPAELVFDPPNVQLTSHFTTFEYDKEKHQIVFKLQDNQSAGAVGQLRINNLKFPNYITPNGTEARIQTKFTSTEISGDAEDVTVTAHAKALWELTKEKRRPIGDLPPTRETNVEYEIVFRNAKGDGNENGSLKAENVTIVDELPEGAEYVSSSPQGEYNLEKRTVTWELPNIAPGDNYHKFIVTVKYPEATKETIVTNKATGVYTPLEETPVTLEAETTHGFIEHNEDWGSGAYLYKEVDGSFREISPGQTVYFYVGGITNAANDTLNNVELVDMTPDGLHLKHIHVPKFTGIDEYKIYIKTPVSDEWVEWKTVSANTNDWLEQFPESVEGIRIVFGDIPPAFEMHGAFMISYELDKNYNVNFPEGKYYDTITNTATVSYTWHGETKKQPRSADVHVVKDRPLLKVAKWANAHTFKTGDIVKYTIRVDNHELSSDIFINPVVEDLLPEGLEYVEGTWKLGSDNVNGLEDPKFEAIENYNETGRTMLRWYWDQDNPGSIPIKGSFFLKFDAKINEKALKGESQGTIENRVEVSSKSGGYINDANFKNQRQYEDGRWYIFADIKIAVNSDVNLESVKWVKGELDEEWSKHPEVATTTPGGKVDYKLAVKNTGTIPVKEVTIVDVLPRIGDTGVIVGAPRGSEWSPVLSDAVIVPDGVKVFYSTDKEVKMNPITGAVSGTWEELPPHDLTTVQALKFVFESVLNPGEEFELVWPMRAPVGAPSNGEVAWNSFGFTANRADNNQALLPAEPIKVGVKIKPSEKAELGDYVWFDENGDGIQNESPQNGVNGVKVDLLDKDGKLIASTITSNDMNGNPGYYLFPNLEPGEYIVQFHLPEGYKGFTKYQQGNDPAKDSDAKVDGTTDVIKLGAGEKNHTIDAGLVKEQKPEVHKPEINKTVNGKDAVKLGTKTELFTYHVNVTIPADTTGYESLEITDQLEDVLEVIQTNVFTGEQDLSSDGTLTTENNKVSFKFKEDFDYEAIAGKVVTLEIKAKIKANADLSHYVDHKVPNKATLIFNAEPTVSNTVVVEVEPSRPVNPGEPGDPEGPGSGPGPGPNPGPGPKEPTNPTDPADPTEPKETPTDPEDLIVIDDEEVPLGGLDPENPEDDLIEITDKVPTGVPTDNKPGGQLPKTGEESMLLLQLAGLGLILIGLMGIFFRRKRT